MIFADTKHVERRRSLLPRRGLRHQGNEKPQALDLPRERGRHFQDSRSFEATQLPGPLLLRQQLLDRPHRLLRQPDSLADSRPAGGDPFGGRPRPLRPLFAGRARTFRPGPGFAPGFRLRHRSNGGQRPLAPRLQGRGQHLPPERQNKSPGLPGPGLRKGADLLLVGPGRELPSSDGAPGGRGSQGGRESRKV